MGVVVSVVLGAVYAKCDANKMRRKTEYVRGSEDEEEEKKAKSKQSQPDRFANFRNCLGAIREGKERKAKYI